MTKSIQEFQGQEKAYSGEFLLGATTPSYDLETEIDQQFPTDYITPAAIAVAKEKFIGKLCSAPCFFCKKDGKRLYEFAREGEAVEVPLREITIREFEIDAAAFPRLKFQVICSKGLTFVPWHTILVQH